ncbi:MAG: FAD-binding protein [Pirellulaceae bacterium]|nr:FAD-binding protein [Pirellulaceae bacterium]
MGTRSADEPFDVIVVGAGGSGLAAAQRGGRVLVLEKQPHVGGTTGIAVGSFTAAGTRWQRAAGLEDDCRAHAEDAGRFAPAEIEARNNGPLREYFLSQAAETLDWAAALGLSFVGPSPEPPNRVPRMHNVVPGAKAYIAALQLALSRAGGSLLCRAAVERLMWSGDRVTGVEARISGQPRTFVARRGVILAAGDYAHNGPLIARYKGSQFAHIDGINPFAGGDGQQLVLAAGGELLNMDVTYGPELRFVASRRRPFQQWLPARGPVARLLGTLAGRLPKWVLQRLIKRLLVTWQHPENSLLDDGAILLNQHGQRFVNERLSPRREIAVAEQPGKQAWLLLDGRLVQRYSAWPHFVSTAPDIAYAYVADYLRLRPDVCCRAGSLAQVARRRRLPAAGVEGAVQQYNAYVRGSNDLWGRIGDRHPLAAAPWVLLGPVKSYFTTTEGGAAVNRQLQVLDPQGRPIPGLYAVGQNGLGGMILWGHGLHIAWALTSGRLAGQAVMEQPADAVDGAGPRCYD